MFTKDHLHFDFETRSEIDLKKCGADVYARDLSTKVMACGFAFNDDPVSILKIGQVPPPNIIKHVSLGRSVIAHNATFEWLIWNYVWRRDFPQLPPLKIEQLDCTMVRCYAMGLPGSLEKASAALGIDDKKDLKGGRVMLQLSQPKDVTPEGEAIWYSPTDDSEKFERMYSYCAQDITVEREIYKRTLPLSSNEKNLWILDHKINQRGIRVDTSSALRAIDIVLSEQKRLTEEMRNVTNNQVATTNAHAQLSAWLLTRGIGTSGVARSDITDLLERQDLPDDVRAALQIRRESAKSSTAKFSSLVARTNKEDQRIRSTTQYHGAGTGRWAGRGFQVHNLPRPKLTEVEIEGVFNVLSK